MPIDQAITTAICEAIAQGSSMKKACEANGIKHPHFLKWVDLDPALRDTYARARMDGWALLADEVITLSDASENDTYIDDDGVVRTNQEVVARSRLRVDSRKWMLSKMLPKVYGDKLALAGDDASPLTVIVRKLTDA